MNRTVTTLVLDAVRTMGTYDPEQVMCLFEEHLTLKEARETQEFLAWVHGNGRTFGTGNVGAVWSEWRKCMTGARTKAPRP